MSSRIVFASGSQLDLIVQETPLEVLDALLAGHGTPFALTSPADGHDLYVNPSTIAYWESHRASGLAGP